MIKHPDYWHKKHDCCNNDQYVCYDNNQYVCYDNNQYVCYDNNQYVCYDNQHDCCDNNQPDFCPPPNKFPKPCMPPVPSVVEGQSLYEAVNNLTKRVNLCINTYNDVMANCYKTLRNLEKAGEENGAYYGPCEVWTEQGYYPDQNAKYTLIHKAAKDRHGCPIKIELGLAYNNTTNSKITQSLASASMTYLADKIITAIPMGDNGWYGNAIWQGAPIQSYSEPTLYSVGFTKNGIMRVYNNTVSTDQMLRDTIVNAMGCSGVLIQNGSITDPSYQQNIPSASVQTSRIAMGQNIDTGEVIILVCGNENNVDTQGLTSLACANILLSYGCDIAVEINEGSGAGVMDKGNLMFVPDNNTIPDDYCFWYISRKCHYKNDYERELAELIQNYGTCVWENYLTNIAVTNLNNDLQTEISNREEADKQLQSNIDAEASAREAADKQLQSNIDAEASAREAADKQLQSNIDAEASAREEADTQLQSNIDAEKSAREAADTQLQNNIDAEASARETADTQLQNNIDAETSARTEAINQINNDITTVENNISNLQSLYNTLNQATLDNTNAITAVQSTITEIRGNVNDLAGTINNISTSVEQIRSDLDNYMPVSGGTFTGNVTMGSGASLNVNTPTNNSNATPKSYVDNAVSTVSESLDNYMPLAGGTFTGNVTMGSGATLNVNTPTEDDNAVNLAYLNTVIEGLPSNGMPVSGGTFTGDVTMGSGAALNVNTPTENNNAVNLGYLNTVIEGLPSNGMPVSGGTFTGDVTMGAGTNLNVNTPTEDANATPKSYVDNTISQTLANYMPKSGGTFTGNVTMGSGSTLNVNTPTQSNNATNKSYVDNVKTTLTNNIMFSGGRMGRFNCTYSDNYFTLSKVYPNDDIFDLAVDETNYCYMACFVAPNDYVANAQFIVNAVGDNYYFTPKNMDGTDLQAGAFKAGSMVTLLFVYTDTANCYFFNRGSSASPTADPTLWAGLMSKNLTCNVAVEHPVTHKMVYGGNPINGEQPAMISAKTQLETHYVTGGEFYNPSYLSYSNYTYTVKQAGNYFIAFSTPNFYGYYPGSNDADPQSEGNLPITVTITRSNEQSVYNLFASDIPRLYGGKHCVFSGNFDVNDTIKIEFNNGNPLFYNPICVVTEITPFSQSMITDVNNITDSNIIIGTTINNILGAQYPYTWMFASEFNYNNIPSVKGRMYHFNTTDLNVTNYTGSAELNSLKIQSSTASYTDYLRYYYIAGTNSVPNVSSDNTFITLTTKYTGIAETMQPSDNCWYGVIPTADIGNGGIDIAFSSPVTNAIILAQKVPLDTPIG